MEKRNAPDLPAKQVIRVPFEILEMKGEKRFDGVDTVRVDGHATVYGFEYEVYGGPPYGWIERVASGAGTKTLSEDPDVVYLANHEGLALARTKSGTLELSEVKKGIHTSTSLDTANPQSRALISGMDRGDIDEMSFAFRTTAQSWEAHKDWDDDPQSLRTIDEFNIHRGDVSAVNFGANPATDISIVRSLDLGALEELAASLSLDELAEARAVLDRRLKQGDPGGMPGEEDRGGMPPHLFELLRIPPNPTLESYTP